MLPKEVEIVEGKSINFVVLPWFLLYSQEARVRLGSSFALYHRPTDTEMIFISNSKSKVLKRYAVYHEHVENLAFAISSKSNHDQVAFKKRFAEAWKLVHEDNPELEHAIRAYLERTGDRAHCVALVMEFALLKREQCHDLYKKVITDSIKDRL